MIIEIKSCGECAFGQDDLKCPKKLPSCYVTPPDDCPLRGMEVSDDRTP